MLKKYYYSLFAIFILFIYSSSSEIASKIITDDVYQSSLELRNNLKVMSIAIKPGYEDLSTLSYLKYSKGAVITSVYITNGEAGENDLVNEYPHQVAARLREQAYNTIAQLDGEAKFLCFPDIISADDSSKIFNLWERDLLFPKLRKLILDYRPDIILLARDRCFGTGSPLITFLKGEINNALIGISEKKQPIPRFFIEGGNGRSVVIPVKNSDIRLKKNYREIGESLSQNYSSIEEQLAHSKTDIPIYSIESQNKKIYKLKNIDDGLPVVNSKKLLSLYSKIKILTDATLKGSTKVRISKNNFQDAVAYITDISDSVDYYLKNIQLINEYEKSLILNWKSNLDKLKNLLLGVSVSYSVSETILTERQLTYLNIQNITGLSADGSTELYFPVVDQGWIINEDNQKRLPLIPGSNMRLVTPTAVEYDYPYSVYNLTQPVFKKPFVFFIIHRAETKEKSFIKKIVLNFNYSPRFTAEIMTPIVSVLENERLVYKLTNQSRDGVSDVIAVRDSFVHSNDSNFKLSYKGATQQDTLFLNWKPDISDGDYLVPVTIDDTKIANFAARKFSVNVDTTKRVGLITSYPNSFLSDALRRLGIKYTEISLRNDIDILDAHDVIIVDRRVLTLDKKMIENKSALHSFAERGGHLIILSQDAEIWNKNPFLEDINLNRTFYSAKTTEVGIDSNHTLVQKPNKISQTDFDNWVYLLNYNDIVVKNTATWAFPILSAKSGSPLVINKKMLRGHISYVDLALQIQLVNINNGAFKLLGNLISF